LFGFPGLPPYDGQHLWSCGPRSVGRAAVGRSGPGPDPIGMSCFMTAGASGGPWLTRVNRQGIGTLVTVTSSVDPLLHVEFGAFQGAAARSAYEAVSRHQV
jgi:hypothetical protein